MVNVKNETIKGGEEVKVEVKNAVKAQSAKISCFLHTF